MVTLGIVAMVSCSKDDEDNNDAISGAGPTVTSTSPASDATGVARNTNVVFTFSEKMDSSTINNSTFILQIGTQLVPGKVVYSGVTATFTPNEWLLAGKPYTATITTGVKDMNGHHLAPRKVWVFVTADSTSTLGVIDLGASGSYVILAKSATAVVDARAIAGPRLTVN